MKIGKKEAARIAAEYGVRCSGNTPVRRVLTGARAETGDVDTWHEIQAKRGRIYRRWKRFEKAIREDET